MISEVPFLLSRHTSKQRISDILNSWLGVGYRYNFKHSYSSITYG